MSKVKRTPVKFLLVDDREENLLALEAVLRRDGLECLKARSGNEALELLLVHDVALAILDVQMPDMDGFALAELMRSTERSRKVPIIFVTAGSQDVRRLFEGYDAGAVDFLFKPLEPKILRHKSDVFFKLYEQRQELAETLRFHETFVATIGHDLKNPLNSIILGANLLSEASSPEAIRDIANRLRASGTRMSHMVDQLFDLSRSRLGSGIPITRRQTELLPIVQAVITEHDSHKHRMKLIANGDTRGRWDPDRIGQIAANLIGNALRHGEAGRSIIVTLTGDAKDVVLSVHNDGAIPEHVIPHLFEPFVSGHANHVRKDGLGLGLYIVEQLVRAHEGKIEVETNPDAGTTISVILPRY